MGDEKQEREERTGQPASQSGEVQQQPAEPAEGEETATDSLEKERVEQERKLSDPETAEGGEAEPSTSGEQGEDDKD